MIVRRLRINPRRVAAPAPVESDESRAEREARGGLPGEVDAMCREWGAWTAARGRLAPRPLGSVLGRLRMPGGPGEGPHVRLDADLAAFNLALAMQSERAQAVLYGLYALPAMGLRWPVKRLAHALQMSRATVYRVRNDAAQRAWSARVHVLQSVSIPETK